MAWAQSAESTSAVNSGGLKLLLFTVALALGLCVEK